MRAALSALVAFIVGACFKPAPQEGFACGLDNWCPGPLFCAADRTCRSADLPGDGGLADGPAADGPAADGPAADGSPGPSKLAFVTSEAFSVTQLMNLDGADAKCMAAAAGKLEGTFVAWLSVNNQPASNRVAAPNGWHRTDSKPFASDLQSLLRGQISNPLSKTEFGVDLNDTLFVFTGTNEAGGATGKDCRALTTNAQTEVITVGSSTGGAVLWTNNGELPCNQAGHLYCLQIDPPEPLLPAREPGSTAFPGTP